MKNLIPLLILTLSGWVQADDGTCEVSAVTESGVVCGLKIRASNGHLLASFVNIPYARPPLGRLRFAEPQPPEPFSGLLNATVRGSVCPQTPGAEGVLMDPLSMAEDCLHVNVFVPISSLPDPGAAENKKPLRKVLAFIHGGAFEAGSGDPDAYGPEFLGAKGVMLVTFNYRLGPFGFLSLNSKYVPGNAGLRDIVFALKWIKRNIRNFGGDPDDVTLGGISAGASLAHLVAISPAVRNQGLFKRVLLMSGNGISDYFTTSPLVAKLMSSMFLSEMGISEFLSPKAIHYSLINAPLEKVLGALKRMQDKMNARLIFTPVLETPLPRFTTVIPKDPSDLVDEGYGSEYPTLASYTNNECQAFRHGFDKLIPTMRLFPPGTLPPRILFGSNILTLPILGERMINEFFNGTHATTDGYLSMCSFSFYNYATMKLVEKRLGTGAEPTYVCEFGYEYKQYPNFLKTELKLNWTGVAHTEDLSFVFRPRVVPVFSGPTHSDELTLPDSDIQMRNWICTMFSNFIKTGRPTEDPTKWPPSGSRFEYLRIKEPNKYEFVPASSSTLDKKRFFDELAKFGMLGQSR